MDELMLKALKEMYPEGTRVKLTSLYCPHKSLSVGDKGTVTMVDAIGTIHVNWDNGSRHSIVYRMDKCEKI